MSSAVCPLCGSSKYLVQELYKTIGVPAHKCRIVCCNDCSHTYTEVLGDIDYDKLYAEGNYEIIDTRGSFFDKLLSIDYSIILRQLLKLNIVNMTILDFGCGKGQFLHRAQMCGCKVKGVETAKNRAEFGRNKYDLDIISDEYISGQIDGSPFDVITLFHVLEHLPNPKKLLSELIENNLTPNGYLIIEVPLFNSTQSKIGGKRWIHLDPPLHISHFTKHTLSNLISELKLNPIRYEYFSIHLGILGMVQSIMCFCGYKKMIIHELKFNRTIKLMMVIILLLPIACFLEVLSVILNRGGVVRVYCQRAPR